MPRFFFHLVSPGSYDADDVGSEFCDVESAFLDAREAAIEMSAEMLKDQKDPTVHQFEIVDAEGRFLIELPFSEVIRPRTKPLNRDAARRVLDAQLQRGMRLKAEMQAVIEKTRGIMEQSRDVVRRSQAQ
jgi:hypothetical protein